MSLVLFSLFERLFVRVRRSFRFYVFCACFSLFLFRADTSIDNSGCVFSSSYSGTTCISPEKRKTRKRKSGAGHHLIDGDWRHTTLERSRAGSQGVDRERSKREDVPGGLRGGTRGRKHAGSRNTPDGEHTVTVAHTVTHTHEQPGRCKIRRRDCLCVRRAPYHMEIRVSSSHGPLVVDVRHPHTSLHLTGRSLAAPVGGRALVLLQDWWHRKGHRLACRERGDEPREQCADGADPEQALPEAELLC
jgi:hypothetical protein